MSIPRGRNMIPFLYIMVSVTIMLMLAIFLYFKLYSSGDTAAGTSASLTLNGPWRFKTGDNPIWGQPGFDDSAWENVDFTAPPGAHDGDVGISGYVPGWASKGYPNYSGYAWYRIKVSLAGIEGKSHALLAPPAVDDAYQVFLNGTLLGEDGDFSFTSPTVYSIQPRMFLLPEGVKEKGNITIAFRVWMSASSLGKTPDVGGIHVAPEVWEKNKIRSKYRIQWHQTIKGYIVEVVEPLIFILLAVTMFLLRKEELINPSKWFIIGLVMLALLRLNQAIFFWLQIETVHQRDIIAGVTLRPLVLGAWFMAWWEWFDLHNPKWMPKFITILTVIYIGAQLFGLSWVSDSTGHVTFQAIADYTRILFAIAMVFIFYQVIVKHRWKDWMTLLAIFLLSASIFSKEVSALGIPGIWFPYGVGVSRTQYLYAAFVLVMYVLLIRKIRERGFTSDNRTINKKINFVS